MQRCDTRARPRGGTGWQEGWLALVVSHLARAVLGVLVALFVWSLVPALFGWHVTVVMSASMSPTLRVGDVIASRPTHATKLRVGQIALVPDPDHAGQQRMHRIAQLDGDRVVLRGDANRADDSSPVRRGDVRGVASLRAPWVGSVAVWTSQRAVAPLLLTGAGLVLLVAAATAYRCAPDDGSPSGTGATEPASGPTGSGRTRRRSARTAPRHRATRRAPSATRRAPSAARRAGIVAAVSLGVTVVSIVAANAAPFGRTTSTTASWQAQTKFACSDALALNPISYLRLNENYGTNRTAGKTALDSSGNNRTGTYSGSGISDFTWNLLPAPCGNQPTATFDGQSAVVTTSTPYVNPTVFSYSLWFNTSSSSGGWLMGATNAPTGSSYNLYDRLLYLTAKGQVIFGIFPGSFVSIGSNLGYNDSRWHHAVATMSAAGIFLYIDGAQVDHKTNNTAQNYTAYLRIGSGKLQGWPAPAAPAASATCRPTSLTWPSTTRPSPRPRWRPSMPAPEHPCSVSPRVVASPAGVGQRVQRHLHHRAGC